MGNDNKLLLPIDDEPLVRTCVQNAIASRAETTIVVLGHEAGQVAGALEGLAYRDVINKDYAEGMSSSLRAGIEAALDYDGIAVLLADMPLLAPGILDRLLDVFAQQEKPTIVAASHQGRRGHPVIWPAFCFPELLALRGDIGGKRLLQKYPDWVIEADAGTDNIFMDIDTRSDLEAARGQPALHDQPSYL